MKTIINYFKKGCLAILLFLIFSIITSILNLIGLNNNITLIIQFILNLLLFIIIGFIHGKKTDKKALILGLKLSLAIIFIMVLLSLILFKYDFKLSNIIYYLTFLLVGISGTILGKNKK